MKTIQVEPVYGYGWAEGDASVETPAPFLLDLQECELQGETRQYSAIIGKVVQAEHSYHDMWAILSVRTWGNPPNYDVWIYAHAHEFSKTALPAEAPFATGFAQVNEIA